MSTTSRAGGAPLFASASVTRSRTALHASRDTRPSRSTSVNPLWAVTLKFSKGNPKSPPRTLPARLHRVAIEARVGRDRLQVDELHVVHRDRPQLVPGGRMP